MRRISADEVGMVLVDIGIVFVVAAILIAAWKLHWVLGLLITGCVLGIFGYSLTEMDRI